MGKKRKEKCGHDKLVKSLHARLFDRSDPKRYHCEKCRDPFDVRKAKKKK